jgi:beta-galactosidase
MVPLGDPTFVLISPASISYICCLNIQILGKLLLMTVYRSYFLIFSVLLAFSIQTSFAQVVFKELASHDNSNSLFNFIEESGARKVIHLNGKWSVYFADDDAKQKTSVSIPSFYNSGAELVFEKSFELNYKDLTNRNFELHFLGLNYSADISINNSVIYRHTGGDFPFYFVLPKDLLRHDKKNTLSVKISSKLDSENTIPVKQRFLAPAHIGGIFRDVYIRVVPNIFISSFSSSYKFLGGGNKYRFTITSKVENTNFKVQTDSSSISNWFDVKFNLLTEDKSVVTTSTIAVQIPKGKEKSFVHNFEINPILWHPDSPNKYAVQIQVSHNGSLLDEVTKSVSFYNINSSKDSLYLNGRSYQLKGVTYIPSNENLASMISYDAMERDLKLIRETGFNAVRFALNTPHPYMLSLCEKYGLLAFIEIPVNSVPGSIIESQNFLARSKNYLGQFASAFTDYNAVAGFGLGTGYKSSSAASVVYINELSQLVKTYKSFLVYASFASFNGEEIPGLDLYGLEFINNSITDIEDDYKNLSDLIGKGKLFISQAGYIANLGSSSGYTNEFTYEAQAKNFSDLITFSEENYHVGYFLNTMFDYQGDYHSFISGYNSDKIIYLGILGERRNLNRITYKVIQSKLNNLEKVTIPLGVRKDDAPMAFILFGLVLALIVGFLINTGRKFREDSSRALLRPYNFYADIRDLRIISGLHTSILSIVVSAVMALTTSSILYHLRTDILFEKFLLSFGSQTIMEVMSFLIWQPLYSLGILTVTFLVLILLLTLAVKLGSLFVMNRVFISNSFFSVTWSFLPIVLIIPMSLVLYRILHADIINLYIYLILIICALWIIYRLIKGIYVIYDVRPSSVYFYSFVILLVSLSVTIFYFQSTGLFVDYILHYIK